MWKISTKIVLHFNSYIHTFGASFVSLSSRFSFPPYLTHISPPPSPTMNTNADGGSSRVSIPHHLRKTLETIREITGKQHSDEDIFAVYKDSFNDPHETAQKLLFLGTSTSACLLLISSVVSLSPPLSSSVDFVCTIR